MSPANYASEMLDALDDIASVIGDTLHIKHMSDKVHSPHCILHRLLAHSGTAENWSMRLAASVDSVSYLTGSELYARAYRVERPPWACLLSCGLGIAWQNLSPDDYDKRVVQPPCAYYDAAYLVPGSLVFQLLQRLDHVSCVYMDSYSHHILD